MPENRLVSFGSKDGRKHLGKIDHIDGNGNVVFISNLPIEANVFAHQDLIPISSINLDTIVVIKRFNATDIERTRDTFLQAFRSNKPLSFVIHQWPESSENPVVERRIPSPTTLGGPYAVIFENGANVWINLGAIDPDSITILENDSP